MSTNLAKEDDLMACPFCGHHLVRSEFHSNRSVERRTHPDDVACILAGIIISMEDREDDMERRAAWNRRASPLDAPYSPWLDGIKPSGMVDVIWRDAADKNSASGTHDAAAINWSYVASWRPHQAVETVPLQSREVGKLGRFDHHPDPAIDFEIEVESLIARLFDAKGKISKPGTEPEAVSVVAEAIARAMTFRVGGDPSCVLAKQRLRQLEEEAVAVLKVVGERPPPVRGKPLAQPLR